MFDSFHNATEPVAASNGASQNNLTSIGVSQEHAAPFSAGSVTALQAMLTNYRSCCNATSSVQTTPGGYIQVGNFPMDASYQEQSVDSGSALDRRIQKLQGELEEINGRLQEQQPDEVVGKASEKVEETCNEQKSNIFNAPCLARGMPFDHNYQTAYFTITDETRHGDELVCSYFDCQKVGIKFRYCAFCKVPVAKRNFYKKHSHSFDDIRGEEKAAPEHEAAALHSKHSPMEHAVSRESNRSINTKMSCIPSKPPPPLKPNATKHKRTDSTQESQTISEATHKRQKYKNRLPNISPSDIQSHDCHNESQIVPGEEKGAPKHETPALHSEHSPVDHAVSQESHRSIHTKDKKISSTPPPSNAKPKRSDTQSVTEPRHKRKNNPPNTIRHVSSDTQSDDCDKDRKIGKWIALLHKRPETRDKRAMTLWLRKVLRVSDSYHKKIRSVPRK